MNLTPLLEACEMQALEAEAIQAWGMPSRVLQEHAALGALAMLPPDEPLHILAGPGNNGGDALALARLAKLRGQAVQVWTLEPQPRWKGDAAAQAALWEGLGGEYHYTDHPETVVPAFQGWVVDGLLGLGSKGPLREAILAWVKALAVPSRSFRMLALDLPTGLDPSSGELPDVCIRAHRTACFGHLKRCHGLKPASSCCGEITVVPIPLPGEPQPRLARLERPAFSSAPWDAHKRQRGRVAIRAGRLGMSGAAVLAALGALRMGAGLVTIFTDAEIRAEVAAQVPEAMVRIWEGHLPDDFDALLVGPGGVTEIPSWEGPLVLDASALKPGEGPRWMARPNTVLTPHGGEFARLFALSQAPAFTDERIQAAQALQGEAVVVLKGAQTLITGGDDPCVWLNATGHSGLATGGTGDLLSGLVVALLAQGLMPREAAAQAVWLHGAAADRLGEGPLMVRDLADSLAALLREIHGA
ncbi:MAG: NAD(P)H-hydrate dehydratase [Firmicutes bacterium]|nr:NAD(P)H-hydrate dehydratase [Bacillota bacterium]